MLSSMLSFNQRLYSSWHLNRGEDGMQISKAILVVFRITKPHRMAFYCYRHGRGIISYSCIYFGRSKFKTIKHYVTTVHSYGWKIVLVQLTTHPKQIAIYLYCDNCKSYVRKRAITILVQKDLLTNGTGQLLLFYLLIPHDFENELFGALY